MSHRHIAPEVTRVGACPMLLRFGVADVLACLDPSLGSELGQSMHANLNPLAAVVDAFAGFLTGPSPRFRCRLTPQQRPGSFSTIKLSRSAPRFGFSWTNSSQSIAIVDAFGIFFFPSVKYSIGVSDYQTNGEYLVIN